MRGGGDGPRASERCPAPLRGVADEGVERSGGSRDARAHEQPRLSLRRLARHPGTDDEPGHTVVLGAFGRGARRQGRAAEQSHALIHRGVVRDLRRVFLVVAALVARA